MSCKCRFRRDLRDERIDYSRKRSVYFDYAASTPVDPAVLGAWDRACRRIAGNPASLNVCGLDAWNLLEESRAAVAGYFHRAPEEIFFCGSGTEALAAGIGGMIERYPDIPIVTSCIEHSAVRHPLRLRELAGGRVRFLPIDSKGKLDPLSAARAVEEAASTLGEGPAGAAEVPTAREKGGRAGNPAALLVLSAVHHETGTVQPIKEIVEAVRRKTPGCAVLIDAVQAASRLAPSEWAPYSEMFAVSGHKIYAPPGIAVLCKSREFLGKPFRLRPLRFGGGQEGNLFPGTPNLPGAAATAEALAILSRSREEETRRLRVLGSEGLDILRKAGIPFVLESPDDAAPGLINLSFPWAGDMTRFFIELGRNLICTSRFSACTESVGGPSRVLEALGVPRERTRTSVRLGFGRFSKREDFFRLADILTIMYKRTGTSK